MKLKKCAGMSCIVYTVFDIFPDVKVNYSGCPFEEEVTIEGCASDDFDNKLVYICGLAKQLDVLEVIDG